MKNILIIFICAFVLFSSCEKNDRVVYTEKSSVYLEDFNNSRDSTVFSLVTSKGNTDTVFLDIKLLGNYLEKPATFGLEVVEELTDAKVDLNYKTLGEFIFPADTSKCSIPVVLVKGDDELQVKEKTLAVRLKAGDLNTGFDDRQTVRIIFSDIIITPEGTGKYGNMTYFIKLFGVYSKKKHRMIAEYMGEDLPLDDIYGMYRKNKLPEWHACSQALSDYCRDNEVIDENGNRIEPWK